MNRKITSRSLLAMVLALAMVFSAMPAFADDAAPAAAKGRPAAEATSYPRGIVEPEVPEIELPEDEPLEAEAAEDEASGEPDLSLQASGDVLEEGSTSDATYSVISNDDGADTVTIKFSKGTASSPLDFRANGDLYNRYKDSVTKVEIAEGITAISNYAFWSCPQLMSVKLPSSLKTIGSGAFAYCHCLSEVICEKPIAIESIGEEAFARCGPNPSKMVTEITALDGAALARACYTVGSLPPGVDNTPEAREQQVKEVYDYVTQLRIELGLEEMSDVQKVKHIYDWVIQNVEYDYEALDCDRTDPRYSHAGCAHSAIFDHLAICSGYVDIMRWLLNESGIDCIECDGGDHAWLIVYLDGAWYALDATWDDQPGIIRYDYFLKSKSSFDASNPENGHSWDDYTGMVTKLYPLSSKNYGEFSSGQYSYLYYGDDYVALTGYRGNAESLTLPETVVYNGDTKRVNIVEADAFSEADQLTRVVIPEGYTGIGSGAFSAFGIEYLSLPSTLQWAGLYAVYPSEELVISYNGTMDQLISLDLKDSGILEVPVRCKDGIYRSPKNLGSSKVTLSQSAFTYDGKQHIPKVTVTDAEGNVLTEGIDYTVSIQDGYGNEDVSPVSVETYIICIDAAEDSEYFGSNYAEFTIKPQPVTLRKLKAKKKALTVYWTKRTSQVSGYQIQLALNKTFTKGKKTVRVSGKNTASKAVKKLKGKKKYYVRVRSYKYFPDDEIYIYSDWSNVKSKKTKK